MIIDLGANPYIRDVDGDTEYDNYDLSNLNNLPSIKSVFFSIKNFASGNIGEPWCYTTGVYDGKFGRVIGKGGEGTVIEGEFNGQPAAFKFVQMKGLRLNKKYDENMKDMNERLKEMTEMMATPGNSILPFQAHFR